MASGRTPQAVRGIYNISGQFGSSSGLLQGTVRDWAEQLTGLALETGMSVFILGTDSPDDVRQFAGEVAPLVREQVAAERLGGLAVSEQESPAVVRDSDQNQRRRASGRRRTTASG